MNLKAAGSGIDAEGFLLFHLCTCVFLSFAFVFLRLTLAELHLVKVVEDNLPLWFTVGFLRIKFSILSIFTYLTSESDRTRTREK